MHIFIVLTLPREWKGTMSGALEGPPVSTVEKMLLTVKLAQSFIFAPSVACVRIVSRVLAPSLGGAQNPMSKTW